MADNPSLIEVTPAEAGQKLLQFLLRRMPLPQPLLHRWIRTGQIRVNSSRAKPFDRLAAGDMVRLPPFAPAMIAAAEQDAAQKNALYSQGTPSAPDARSASHSRDAQSPPARQGGMPAEQAPFAHSSHTAAVSLPLPPVIYADADIIIFNKHAGLPVHGGTGHSDSLAARIVAHYSGAPFMPTPAHRLDKDTSGLIMAAASYRMLRALQDALRNAALHKEYLAWVEGQWPDETPRMLRHRMAKSFVGSDERVRVSAESGAKNAGNSEKDTVRSEKDAACVAACVRREAASPAFPQGRSLMQIRLFTGRTHQIRVQLASEGYPVCGDGKYGRGGGDLRLHALRLILPDGREFTALPAWEGGDRVADIPPPLPAPVAE